jgi:Na+-translocating ferredoxin:NAD+ oxidoreductase subunit G
MGGETKKAESKGMPETLTGIGLRLAVICTVAALVLASVNMVTAPVIEANRARALQEALERLVGDAPVGERRDVPEQESEAVRGYYPVDGGSEGYVLELVGNGYGGDMQILAGFRPDGELFSATLMANTETPGLGKEAERPGYMEKFVGHGDDDPVPTRVSELEPEEADSVSGATLTFIGIARALEAGSSFVTSGGISR